ncbi:MAG TPA: glycosyltransferase family 2 protein, partial [Bacteroidia bacterium]|nr:glycosyltransferase family 2 protein [Bacteroidia bacterium]
MNNSPLVSVILPNYNHARFLEQRIKSILSQTFRDFEIIILDDCSTDNSREIIDRYRSDEKISHVIFNETNSGSAFSQWKKGIQSASGTYIWIAESDDFCDPDFLFTGVNKLNKG